MHELFKSIKTKLEENVPELSYFEWDNGQYRDENAPTAVTPGVLMDVANLNYESPGRGKVACDLQVRLKCGFRNNGMATVDFLALLHKIGATVEGVESPHIDFLHRKSLLRLDEKELKVYELVFSVAYYLPDGDLSATTVVPKPPLEMV